ncbi:MAG: c-type cytochrome, partial [Polyangiaceae bacterium]|nr:c-type cytochrome [Polyangiaceae bacterium]
TGRPERRVPPCAPCHGPRDEPHRPTYPRLAGQHAAYLEQQLRLFTERTRGGGEYAELMRAVTEHALAPEEITAVARYYAALPGEGREGAD